MQNQDPDSPSPVIGPLGQPASEMPPRPLAAAGRRRTQEQGQGDLDDDWQDTTPAAEPEEATNPGQLNPAGS